MGSKKGETESVARSSPDLVAEQVTKLARAFCEKWKAGRSKTISTTRIWVW